MSYVNEVFAVVFLQSNSIASFPCYLQYQMVKLNI